nr:MAG TPA: hypothetical protein [Caudoviricetes sp.]
MKILLSCFSILIMSNLYRNSYVRMLLSENKC